jgi:hypothetical protein
MKHDFGSIEYLHTTASLKKAPSAGARRSGQGCAAPREARQAREASEGLEATEHDGRISRHEETAFLPVCRVQCQSGMGYVARGGCGVERDGLKINSLPNPQPQHPRPNPRHADSAP